MNEALFEFHITAIEENLPITFIDIMDGNHAFDYYKDQEISRIIKDTLEFLKFYLPVK
jgi:hypothetical protein